MIVTKVDCYAIAAEKLGKARLIEIVTDTRQMFAQKYIPIVGTTACFSVAAVVRGLVVNGTTAITFAPRSSYKMYITRREV